MATTILSSKGQLINPKTVRSRHHWQAGTVFVVLEEIQEGLDAAVRSAWRGGRPA